MKEPGATLCLKHIPNINMLKINQENPFKNFKLPSELIIDTPISVLVGLNGAGKSRFIEAISETSNTAISVKLNDHLLIPLSEIRKLDQRDLQPQFGVHHDVHTYEGMLLGTIQFYKLNRSIYDEPYNEQYVQLHRRHISQPGIGYPALYRLTQLISRKVSKKPSQLSESDIRLHFVDVQANPLGAQDVSAAFNRYLVRRRDNEMNQFKRTKGKDVPAYSDSEFISKFGEKPWVILNEILVMVFDGKFHFPTPNEDTETFDEQTPLLDQSQAVIAVDNLSSGEKTLLWLALTLFNIQYQEADLLMAPKLLLLDEPDAFLHPKMVEKMFLVLNEFRKKFGTWIILITHSPTTAALSPDGSLYEVKPNSIRQTDKDSAIAELLDGVPHIAVDPANRRQVFVESHYDSLLFQNLFDYLKTRSTKLDQRISLTFVPSGPKMPKDQISRNLKKVFQIKDEQEIDEFVAAINGSGNCKQVYGLVESLAGADAVRVRGLVDWDEENKTENGVVVLGENYVYAIENILLDPLAILLKLHYEDSVKFPHSLHCGKSVTSKEWLEDIVLLQNSLDYFIKTTLGVDSERDEILQYRTGLTLKTDKRYLRRNGHNMEKLLRDQFPALRKIAHDGNAGQLKCRIVCDAMIAEDLIPACIESAFVELQK